MSGALSGKVALITGGSKGIGKATALLFASQGAKVAINYGSDKASADQTIAALPSGAGLAIQADAGTLEGIEKIVSETVSAFGKIDVLVPNAGVLPMRDTASTTEADFDAIFRLNVKGPFFLVQKALPHLAAGAHIIHLSTTINASSSVLPGYLLYCCTKGAIDQLTRVQAKDLGRQGIYVNAIAPGPTETELFRNGKSEQLINMIKSGSPFNRLGQPGEIAEAMLTAATTSWMSGQVVRVNGAMV
jgi:3-oxoacyl-[acyl-carrier protein] reductase